MLYLRSPMNRKLQNLINLTVPVVLIFGTISVYLFAKGYRYNFENGEIEKTGVISIKTHPRRADIYIDEELIGTSPKAIGGISEGNHSVRIEKDGYHPWTFDVNVLIEQLVPLEIQLIPKDPTIEILFSESSVGSCDDLDPTTETVPETVISESKLLGFFTDTANQTALFAHLTNNETCIENTTPQENTGRVLEIWSYPIRRQFWELNADSEVVAEFDEELLGNAFSAEEPKLNISISPDGNRALVSIILSEIHHFFLINTNSYNSDITDLKTIDQNTEIPPVWSNDSQYLILTKGDELRSYNVNTETVAVVTQIPAAESSPFYWTTSTAGQLFFPLYSENTLSIIQSNPDGSNQNAIIELPLKTSSSELLNPEETGDLPDDSQDSEVQISIDPEHLLEISDMTFTPLEDTLIFFSDSTLIVYSLEENSGQTFPSDEPEFISFSPNQQSLIIINNGQNTLDELWFDVEETDPLHSLGTRTLLNLSGNRTYSNVSWHPNQDIPTLFMNMIPQEEDPQESQFIALDTVNGAIFTISASYYPSSMAIDSSGRMAVAQCSESEICLIHFEE